MTAEERAKILADYAYNKPSRVAFERVALTAIREAEAEAVAAVRAADRAAWGAAMAREGVARKLDKK